MIAWLSHRSFCNVCSAGLFALATTLHAQEAPSQIPLVLPPPATISDKSLSEAKAKEITDLRQTQEASLQQGLLSGDLIKLESSFWPQAHFTLSQRNEANTSNITTLKGRGTTFGQLILEDIRREVGKFEEFICRGNFLFDGRNCVGFVQADRGYYEMSIIFYQDKIIRLDFRHFTPEEWSKFDHMNPKRANANG